MPKLTKRFVDALKPVTRDTLYRDDDLSGFALRVKPSGARTFVVQYRNAAGRTRKLALGRVGVLTPDEARQRARKALGQVADGRDPSATRNAARGAMTVADLCRDYLADANKGLVLSKKSRRPKAASTLAADQSRIDCHIVPELGRMAVEAVQPDDVRRFMGAIQTGKTATAARSASSRMTGGSGSATRVIGLLGGIFTYAVKGGIRTDNPVRGVERPADGKRNRYLSAEEYRTLGKALVDAEREGESPIAITAVRLLALTGCRSGEVMSLTWPAVDLEDRKLRLAQTKEGYSERPLGRPAADLLANLPRGADADAAILSTRDGRHYGGLRRAWARIIKRTNLKGVLLHTLRHSFATTARSLGYSRSTIGDMLGHSQRTVTSGYIHVVDPTLVAAADRVAGAIARWLAGEKDAKVMNLRDRRPAVASR